MYNPTKYFVLYRSQYTTALGCASQLPGTSEYSLWRHICSGCNPSRSRKRWSSERTHSSLNLSESPLTEK
uniref:Uncharacterized protein n=1 Tax=Anopheles arabiensis TaxID=7173 RepID=A0A182IGJ4_ANOAR